MRRRPRRTFLDVLLPATLFTVGVVSLTVEAFLPGAAIAEPFRTFLLLATGASASLILHQRKGVDL